MLAWAKLSEGGGTCLGQDMSSAHDITSIPHSPESAVASAEYTWPQTSLLSSTIGPVRTQEILSEPGSVESLNSQSSESSPMVCSSPLSRS